MNAKLRPFPHVALIVFVLLLFLVPGWSGRPVALHAQQSNPAPELDRALRAGDLTKARQLFPVSWAATEQLFVSYLERAFLSLDAPGLKPGSPTSVTAAQSESPTPFPGGDAARSDSRGTAGLQTGGDARTLTGRWAEVHFRIVEYDFARSVVLALDPADAARRQQLVSAVRDYFVTLERLRAQSTVAYAPNTEPSSTPQQRAAEQRLIYERFLDIAGRFRALSFPRGELWTLRSMLNVRVSGTPPMEPRANSLADQLGDELSLLGKRPFTEASLAMAERLGLLTRQRVILEELSRSPAVSADPAKLEQAARYLERARVVARGIPPLESVNYWLFPAAAPRDAAVILPDLWRIYETLKRPADAQRLFSEALEISRPFGERALLATMSAFAGRADSLDWEIAAPIAQASQAFGVKFELATMRQLSGIGSSFRNDVAEKTLALAVAVADAHERAVTLEWYSRGRQQAWFALRIPARPAPAGVDEVAKRAVPFPPAYDQLLDLCLESDEVGLTADALANQAVFEVETGSPAAGEATFIRAIQHAERAGNFKKAAQVANKASHASLPIASRVGFASRAIEVARKANDARELEEALRTRALTSFGASNESLRDLEEALAAAERYTAQSGDASEEVKCLLAMANERDIRGEYQAAIDVLERTVRRTSALARRDDEIAACQRMTRIYSERLGEPALALAAAERARVLITSFTTASGGPPAQEMIATENFRVAPIYRDLGQPVAALEAYSKAAAGFTGIPRALPQLRMSLSSRARLLTELGDYESALRDWNDVLPLLKTTERNFGGSAYVQGASWLADVARAHFLAGDREEALSQAREAIAELNKAASEKWVTRDFIESVVDILLEANAPDEVIAFCNAYYKQVLALPIVDPVVRKSFLETVARAQIKAGRLDEARTRLLAAVEIDRNNPTAEYGGLGGSLLALGKLEIEAGNYAKAKEYLVAARAAANPYHLEQIWQIERALAVALARMGDGDGAAARYDAALSALEAVREQIRPEEFRARYGEDRTRIYEEHAGLLAARALSSGRQADAVRAFQAAERKRAQIVRSLLATGWQRTSPETLPDQLRRTLDLESRIGAKQALLRGQFDQPAAKRNTALVDTLQRDLEKLQAEHTQALRGLAQGQYRFAAPTALAASLAGPVQAALGSSRVIVEYLVTDSRSFAFVVSARGVKVVPLEMGRAALRKSVQHLLAPFRQLRVGEVDLARLGFDTAASYALHRSIFAPVQPSLRAATEIVIVPDDVLHVLPFDVLLEKPQRAARGQVLHAEFSEGPFLLRRYAISYLTSAAQALSIRGAATSPQPAKRLFAMANPTATGAAMPAPSADDPLKRQLRSGRLGEFLTPVPGAEAEVRQIASSFSPDATTVVSGANATEAAYKTQAPRHRIVHFATHALASDGQPLYSTLILAPDSAANDDGFLQAYEVLRTPLGADLVVLSGCETALGAEDWGQGLVGLVAAFQQAGARSVLATLWSIDEVTADVMASFYRSMTEGRPASAALRQAKLQMLGRRVRIGKAEMSLAHPFFWAPFILVGAPANPPAGR